MKEVTIYTDGACSGNPGPGGWAAILRFRDNAGEAHERIVTGSEAETTNNRMELTAAASALETLTEPCRVRLHTDSAYLVNAFVDGWLENWKGRGWKKANKKPVLNRDLWERLDAQTQHHNVDWVKVEGHAGVELNEAVDRLAVREIEKLREHERLLDE